MSDLTPRQLQILRLITEGHTTGRIAKDLLISHATVKSTMGDLFERLGAHRAAQAVHVAYQRGILLAEPADADAVALVRLAERMGYRIALVPLEDA